MPKLSEFELRTLPGIQHHYAHTERQLAFRAQSQSEAEQWQVALRETLRSLLGLNDSERCPLDVHLIKESAEDGYRRELIVMQTAPGEYMPCYVLIPQNVLPPFRPVIALHGHGSWGVKSLMGVADSPLEQEFIDQYHQDFALQLVQQGYLVFAPMLRGFAQRMESGEAPLETDDTWLTSCLELSLNALMLGKTLLGLRIWDVMRLVDYIQTRPEPMHKEIACVGFSGGATVTLMTTALEPRINAAVISGYFNTFRNSLMSVSHCACNYIPNLLNYAEMADLAGLIAPRPLFIESGLHDPLYSIEGTRRAVADLERIYSVMEASPKLHTQIFDGAHRWDGQGVYDWLAHQFGVE
ncbi:MAG: alpha/beta hydrolase family protein [Chloroflexota bacterium]